MQARPWSNVADSPSVKWIDTGTESPPSQQGMGAPVLRRPGPCHDEQRRENFCNPDGSGHSVIKFRLKFVQHIRAQSEASRPRRTRSMYGLDSSQERVKTRTNGNLMLETRILPLDEERKNFDHGRKHRLGK